VSTPVTTWAGNVTYSTGRALRPRSTDEAREQLRSFRRLARAFDADGTFRNDVLERHVLDVSREASAS
jgi:hypothetical protein